MSWRGYMVGTYGCRTADAAANYRMQNPHRSIGMSNRAAAAALNGGGCPSNASSGAAQPAKPNIDQALTDASKTGQGITKPELKDIVSQALDQQGSAKNLSKDVRQALSQAVQNGSFARRSTAQLALQLSQGQIAPAAIGARMGRAQ